MPHCLLYGCMQVHTHLHILAKCMYIHEGHFNPHPHMVDDTPRYF